MKEFVLGIDFGSNSARALIIDVASGMEYGSSSCVYPGGDNGVFCDPNDPDLARQHPSAYIEAMEASVKGALSQAVGKDGFSAAHVIGIGVDATASTPVPVDRNLTPLAASPEFSNNLNAYAWMWKDHTAIDEAEAITVAARQKHPEYLARCGGSYSPEWFWSKLWHCLKVDRKVFDAAYAWLDFPDFVPATLGGITDISQVKVGVCAAGHKSLYSEAWGGFPADDFLDSLAPELAELKQRLYAKAYSSDTVAARLCPAWAERLGLPEGIPVAVGIIDAHSGAVGAGVGKGRMVKVLGTSSCDILAEPAHEEIPDIPGICGVVAGSVLPGSLGIEAGQAAVGDIFNWFVTKVCDAKHELFSELNRQAAAQSPGQSGLLALDWQNGNRNILCDQQLTGLLLGMTLHTTQAEIFRALIEATAFGARKIIDRLDEYGIVVKEIVCCGGIAEKNPLLMQIYADILGRKLLLPASDQSCAYGAAIFAAVAAGKYETVEAAQQKLCTFKKESYTPNAAHREAYDRLYELYSELHDSFGTGKHARLMKKLRRN